MKNVINSICKSKIGLSKCKELRLIILYDDGFLRCFIERNSKIIDYKISPNQMIEIYEFIKNDEGAKNKNKVIITIDTNDTFKISYKLDYDFTKELSKKNLNY